MAIMPSINTTCGGLSTLTSSPYALCHQLSKGPEAIMAKPPQAQRNAPSGPRKVHSDTAASRAARFRPKVVARDDT